MTSMRKARKDLTYSLQVKGVFDELFRVAAMAPQQVHRWAGTAAPAVNNGNELQAMRRD